MINTIQKYLLVAASFATAVLVYIFYSRGKKLAELQAELFSIKANEEVRKSERKTNQARVEYLDKRAEYNRLARKFQQRARDVRRNAGGVRSSTGSSGRSNTKTGRTNKRNGKSSRGRSKKN